MTGQAVSVRYAVSPAMTAAAALAVVCASTALSGVIGGMSWLAYVVVAAIVVAGTGLALRAFRTPPVLVAVVELFVLLCLLVVLFTNSGVLGLFPGPQALSDLGGVLSQSMDEVRNGVPPVDADTPILCLVVVAIGLVTVAVDALAVTARVPAAAGLVLLCVYAVPASLDDSMLPWWSFLVGAASFTLLLAVDGVHRHQLWRGKLGLPAAASSGVAQPAIVVAGIAAVIALVVGSTFTIVGTVGRLPGDTTIGGGGTGRLGIEPFTTLRGMLQEKGTTELFDVRGLPANPPYLRSVTLSHYIPNKGWVPDTQLPGATPANAVNLPGQAGDTQADGPAVPITIDPVSWEDYWLPVFGVPERLQGVSTDYHYDADSGVVYSAKAQHPPRYQEMALLNEPTADQLRGAGTDYSAIDPKYSHIGRNDVSPRVRQLAQQLTASAPDEFDKAQAIWRYFTNPANGFTYSTSTAPAESSDALVDFLFNGKTGYCEQYATAMGVMLRTLGIPVRVAIGFTDGYQSGDHRTITSQDAHAWDEVYFPGYGWITFDPTPLGDGRTHVPTYLSTNGGGSSNPGGIGRNNPAHEGGGTTVTPTTSPTPTAPNLARAGQQAAPAGGSVPGWQVWLLCVVAIVAAGASILAARTRPGGPPGRLRELHPLWVAVAWCGWGFAVLFASTLVSWWLTALLIVLGIAAAPAVIREARRRRRWRAIVSAGPEAAGAAWAEIVAESWDRGTVIPDSETVRTAAHRMVREHDLDDEGRESLRSLVGAVERSWYGARNEPDPAVGPAFDGVCRSLRRNAPLALRAKLMPRSVLRPAKPRGSRRQP